MNRPRERRPKAKTADRPRLGPRPLPLHLATQIATLLYSQVALPSLKNGSLAWNPRLRQTADQLRAALVRVDASEFDRALSAEAGRRIESFLAGIETYRGHPYRRHLAEPNCVWRMGAARLLDYSRPGADGPTVLAVPSLVNRAYILDLTAHRSMMRSLARRGLRPLLLDWGAPGETELNYGLDEYVGTVLAGALSATKKAAGRPVVLGYCMGGLLALALGILRPRDIRGLVLFATPWDFHRPDLTQARAIEAMRKPIEDAIDLWGGMPVDVLQACFAAIDPGGIERKFRVLAEMEPTSPRMRDFVALEDWLNDGVMLAGPVARETLFGWYVENRPARGTWTVKGKPIRPERYKGPALVLVPARDRIVPPSSALALAHALPRAETVELDTGHIGMVTAALAPRQVYARLAAWLRKLD
jgi:polyhydroxyalkanoate synthase